MSITTSGTTLTFNDATTQTTAPVNTNANVNSVSGGTAISVSATTGAVTVNNTGVTSIASGSGISVSGTTGGVTVTNTQPFSGSTSQLVKAWVNLTGYPSIVINNSFNISSITNPSSGVYTINFTTSMPNANYVILGSGNTPSTANGTFQPVYSSGVPPTTTSVQILTTVLAGTASNLTNIYVAILGT